MFTGQEEISKARHGFSKSRPRHLGKKITQQFLQQINNDEFDTILVQSKPRPAKKSVQAPVDSLRFVFQPIATSTPRRNIKVSEPTKVSTMPQSEPSPEENHRLEPRLTMSQFIGAPLDKHKEHDRRIDMSSHGFITVDDEDEIAVKLPNYIRDASNDFETIIVNDFTDGEGHAPEFDLNKTQGLMKIIFGEDYHTNSTFAVHDLDVSDLFLRSLNDDRKAMSETFAINNSTRCTFKNMFRDSNTQTNKTRSTPKKRGFEIPNPREFFKNLQNERKPTRKTETFSDFLSEQLRPQRKQMKVSGALQFRDELRDLYEFLKLLFADTETDYF